MSDYVSSLISPRTDHGDFSFLPPDLRPSVAAEARVFLSPADGTPVVVISSYAVHRGPASDQTIKAVRNFLDAGNQLRELVKRSGELEKLGDDGHSRPTGIARLIAGAVLAKAAVVRVVPDRIAATQDEGVILYFLPNDARSSRYASLECHATGELVLLCADRASAQGSKVREIEVHMVDEALKEIGAFLDSGPLWAPSESPAFDAS
jgi:hypothetical protein